MRTILRIVSVIVIGFVFMGVNVNAQGAVSRDFSEICQDTLINVGGGVFEGGHFTGMLNWAPEEGKDGYLAVVTRDDFLVHQGFWDCSNDIVSGSITERTAPGQGVTLRQMNLNYQMPLEVWTWDHDLGPGVRVLDNGFFEATFVRKMIIPEQGFPLNVTCQPRPQPGPFGSYFFHVAGEGIAFGTGEGEFYEGQMVRVNVTQTAIGQRNRPDKDFPNWDGWPVENIILTPIN